MLAGVVGLAPGAFHTILWKQDGSVWSTGVNSDSKNASFVRVIPSEAIAAAAGSGYSMVIKQDGSVWATGKKSRGQVSFFGGSATSRGKFFMMKTMQGAKAVAAGSYYSLVLAERGYLWVVGWNKYGQLGDGSTDDRSKFTRVGPFGIRVMAMDVDAGEIHSIVLTQDGSVWAAGRNYHGQLGDGSRTDRNHFVKVMSNGAADVTAGGYHSMVVKKDGSIWATGHNGHGQLGDGSTTDHIDYVKVVLSGAKAVAAGSRHSMMLKQDGSVWATGNNQRGQLGDGWTTDSYIFVQVISNDAKTVAAGSFHSMVLKEQGSIWATGSNNDGQFGDGSTTSRKTFIRLAPFSDGPRHDFACINSSS